MHAVANFNLKVRFHQTEFPVSSLRSFLGVVGQRVASAGGDEALDGFDGLDATAGADGGAVERGGGAGEIELLLQEPTLQESVNKARMKNVTSAGGVHRLNSKCRGVVELRPVPCQYAFFAECCGGKAATKSFAKRGQGLPQIRFFHQPPGDIPAGDEVVNAFQERVHAGIKFVQVSDDGDACGARPACRGGRSRGVVTIHVKRAGMNDPIALKFFRSQSQTVVAFPKNGAFAGVIDKDESLLAGTSGRGEEMRLDAEARKFRAMELGGDVVPDLANVARASPTAGRQSSRWPPGRRATPSRSETRLWTRAAGSARPESAYRWR